MVKASLRKSNTPPPPAPAADDGATTVVVTDKGREVLPAPGVETLETMVDEAATQQPPTDNAHVAEGCEKFAEPAQTGAITRRPASAVSVPRNLGLEEAGFSGDWGADDVKFPQLKLVQGSGQMSQLFDIGTIILDEQELLPPPSVKADAKNPSIRFIPLHIQKQFREKLGQEAVDAGEMPRIFNTVDEVEEAGLTTRWVGNTMPDNFAEASSKQLLLIEKPEGSEHPGFAMEIGGKSYALALFYAAGGAYRNTAKVIFNNASTSLLIPAIGADGQPLKNDKGVILKKPLMYKYVWEMSFKKVKAGNFNPWRPFIKLDTKSETSAELRAYIRTVLTSNGFSEATATE